MNRRWVLCFALLVFLSGIAGLLFETLWLRVSGLVFGNSVWSAALILSSFMAGLALGNAIAARSRLRGWRPLRLYALLEIAAAGFGCLVVFLLPVLGSTFRPLFEALSGHQTALAAARLTLSFLILLVPTTAMGMTLAVLVEDPLLRQADFGHIIGILYGCNTAGAVIGALSSELYLIAAVGIGGTAVAAALASCLAAATAFLLSNRMNGQSRAATRPAVPIAVNAAYQMPWRLLLVSFGAGAVLLCLEVIWFRVLGLYIFSTSTAFAVMLAVVLTGIAFGGFVAGITHGKVTNARNWLPLILLSAALLTLLTYIYFPGPWIGISPPPYHLVSFTQAVLLSTVLTFPVALLSGIIFPLTVAGAEAQIGDRMNSTGITTLFNTAGSALGPIVATFLLLPRVGFQASLMICGCAYVVLGLVASYRDMWSSKRAIGVAFVLLTAAFVGLLLLFPYSRAEAHFSAAAKQYEVDDAGVKYAEVVARIEGNAETYQLLRRDLFGQPYYYRLLTNAFSMSATNPPQRYMRLFAYLPVAFHPLARDVLLICYGCGVTADAFTREPNLRHIDIVDTSKEVFALADRYLGSGYENPLLDSRVKTFVQDGRFFLQATPRRYDVISGEPPPPKIAGAVNLYTQDFFSLMRSRLNEGGIVTFWLPLDQLKIDEAKAILRGFHNAFPNCSVWAASDEQWIMMGINGPAQPVAPAELRRLWENASTRDDLLRIGVEVPQQLGALFVMDSTEIERLTSDRAPLTDFYPKRLSDAAWDQRANETFVKAFFEPKAAWQRFAQSPLIRDMWPATWRDSVAPLFNVREMRYVSSTSGSNALAELDFYLRSTRLRTPVLELLHSDAIRVALADRASAKSSNPPPDAIADLIAGALARREYARAISLIETQRKLGAFEPNDLYLLTYLYCLSGEVQEAEKLVATNAGMITRDWFVDWLWAKLKTDFGFQPPV